MTAGSDQDSVSTLTLSGGQDNANAMPVRLKNVVAGKAPIK